MKRTMIVMTTLLAVLASSGCLQRSELIEDDLVGINGGFEHVRSGLPVNWLVYSPSTIPTGDYELVFDRTEVMEGEQSLKFEVRECSATGGWYSPGIAREYSAIPGESYLISFWIKNRGCDYVVKAGGVAPKTARLETIDSSTGTARSWKHVEVPVTITEPYQRLRFELSVRSPGSLWIDDVRIERQTTG